MLWPKDAQAIEHGRWPGAHQEGDDVRLLLDALYSREEVSTPLHLLGWPLKVWRLSQGIPKGRRKLATRSRLQNQTITVPPGEQFVAVGWKGEITRETNRLAVARTKHADDGCGGHRKPRREMYIYGYTSFIWQSGTLFHAGIYRRTVSSWFHPLCPASTDHWLPTPPTFIFKP